ncbi:3-hydroxyisobutyrate dehydrogenase/glyoxylate/succinic semialdehyde reductase [Tumebacillus sp. BK434]|uniref:NAD(P)-dependent oxidoreductase n=1 Tax=Tumebacillus sp. BK434 TaxID=2512169 RepID=UPI00104E0E5E|nr:NAD(P)-dependent oxidoreductase [Tumebacillus sp. BK434]TCP54604.1 3-hydroxyisobutyrate dehydrogenase/glyoxylate/succinic semialdehyde reductase [Tumebacillus sp. BK434]
MLPTIGWIGLGNMGRPMVTNLLNAGYDITVYNRTASSAAPFVEQGAKLADSPKALAEQVDVVITMVSDSAALEAVLEGETGLLRGVRAGQSVIDMSTIAPEASRQAAARLQEQGVGFLDAPVSGSVKPATDGTLVILVGGPFELYEQHLPIFDVLGKRSFHFGDNGQGANAKLVINMLLGITMQGLSEALVLGAKTGLDRATLLEMVGVTACASPIIALKTPNIIDDNFAAAFALKHMEKDFGLALDAARQAEASLPATAAAHQTFLAAKANGHGDDDIAAILVQLEKMSGLR